MVNSQLQCCNVKMLIRLTQEELGSTHHAVSMVGVCSGHFMSVQVMSEDHRALVREVREGVQWLERKLASAEDRTHHRHLHAGLLAEKVPKPVLKQKAR